MVFLPHLTLVANHVIRYINQKLILFQECKFFMIKNKVMGQVWGSVVTVLRWLRYFYPAYYFVFGTFFIACFIALFQPYWNKKNASNTLSLRRRGRRFRQDTNVFPITYLLHRVWYLLFSVVGHWQKLLEGSVRNSACPLVRDKWLFTRTSKQSVSSYPSDKWKFTTIFYCSLSFYYNAVVERQNARDFTLENRQRSRCNLMSQK